MHSPLRLSLCAIALVQCALCASSSFLPKSSKYIPPAPQSGASTPQWALNASTFPYGLDGAKFDFYNDTAFEWWYFDTLSLDKASTLVIQFFANVPAVEGDDSFPFTGMELTALLPNGTIWDTVIFGEGLTIITDGAGSSGVLNGTGCGWTGSPDLSKYTVYINTTEVQASISMHAIAPTHAACGPAVPGASLSPFPNVGWINAVPDAEAKVSLTVDGEELVSFKGTGYHDMNWSPSPLPTFLGSWYWGRARLGPYSLVWADYIAPTGIEYVTGYAAMYGQIVAAKCAGLTVRPTGANSTYPPQPGQGAPDGFHIEFHLGAEGVLEIDVENEALAEDDEGYTRWVGKMSGGLKGGAVWDGVAVYEWMRDPSL